MFAFVHMTSIPSLAFYVAKSGWVNGNGAGISPVARWLLFEKHVLTIAVNCRQNVRSAVPERKTR